MRVLIRAPEHYEILEEALVPLQQADIVALDIETVSLNNRIPLGIAVASNPSHSYYFFNTQDELLPPILNRCKCIIHNAKFDLPILAKLGYTIQSYDDTKILAYSAGILENSLAQLAYSMFNGADCPTVESLWTKKDQGNIGIDHTKLAEICLTHASYTYELYQKLPHTQLYDELDKPIISLIMEMEKNGLLVDQYALTEVEQQSATEAAKLALDLYGSLGYINLASNLQVGRALQQKGILGTRKTRGNKMSVSEESLASLNHPITNTLLKWKKEMKTLTTYIPAFRNVDMIGRIHTNFGYTDTGRFSSSRPNLQNITRGGLRNVFITPLGYTFISIDADQIELRVLAISSQDPIMLQALETNDLHLATAIAIWNDPERRYDGKQLNFAIVYGADEYKVAEMTGLSVPEALNLLNQYFATYPVLKEWIDTTKEQARQDGYVVNIFGRKRPIPELHGGSVSLRAKGEREAVNTISQGTAVDIVKQMMLYLKNIISSDAKFVNQVHDEILLEVPDSLVPDTLEKVKELIPAFPSYPVTVKVGKCYGALEKVDI